MKRTLKILAFNRDRAPIPIVPFVVIGELPGERWLSATDGSALVFAFTGGGLLTLDVLLPIPSSIVIALMGGRLGFYAGWFSAWLGLTAGNSARLWDRPALAAKMAPDSPGIANPDPADPEPPGTDSCRGHGDRSRRYADSCHAHACRLCGRQCGLCRHNGGRWRGLAGCRLDGPRHYPALARARGRMGPLALVRKTYACFASKMARYRSAAAAMKNGRVGWVVTALGVCSESPAGQGRTSSFANQSLVV